MTKRFCCWCGKIEYTELCESESIKSVVAEIAKSINGEHEDEE